MFLDHRIPQICLLFYTILNNFGNLQVFLDIAIYIIHISLISISLFSLLAGGAVQPFAEGEKWLAVPHRGRPGGPERASEEAQVCRVSGLLHTLTHITQWLQLCLPPHNIYIHLILLTCANLLSLICNVIDEVIISQQLPTIHTKHKGWLNYHFSTIGILCVWFSLIWDPAVLLCYSRTCGGRRYRAWAGK